MVAFGADRPAPLPVQALDQATGYLMAASVVAGLVEREERGTGTRWSMSLARAAKLLSDQGRTELVGEPLQPAGPTMSEDLEETSWGRANRLAAPLLVDGAPLQWSLPARPLGSDPASFPPR